jgi:hypothetical protein
VVKLEPVASRRSIAWQLIWFGFWVAITAVALYLKPSPYGHGTHTQLGLPPCPTILMMGKPCPGCGLTTSWTAFAHGDIVAAFKANAAGPFLYLAFTTSALVSLYGWLRGARLDLTGKAFNWAMVALVTLFVTYGAIRFFVADYSDSPLRQIFRQLR